MPKLRSDDGSEGRNWEAMTALEVEIENRWWLWMPKLRSDDDDSERQTEDATLNVDLKINDGSERQN